ncbi:MAG: hypothetical protein ACTH32_06345 [Microbacterium gubbeenense]|uniref:hypothetical protein n=1 Tax=Microbacterium gubbeenense TaxID=159896 RepID=UPI003F952C58
MASKMWFGTEDHMEWIDTPLSGADVSAEGWGVGGTLLNGGGWGAQSFGGHKNYNFSWSNASARQSASKMEAYRRGSYGRGLIYFHDPLTYDTNILPAHWADPSSAIGGEAPSLVRNANPVAAPVPSNNLELPVLGAKYTISQLVPTGYPGKARSLFIPVPPGYNLRISAVYESTSTSAGVYWAPATAAGVGTVRRLAPVAPGASPSTFPATLLTPGSAGVRIWAGRSGTGGTVTLYGIVARLIPKARDVSNAPARKGRWAPGDGHSGTIFQGFPTRTNLSGVNGGQVGYAATFREVGAWQ